MSVDVFRKIRQVQRRLNGNRFLGSIVWSLTAALSIAAGLAFVGKLTSLPVSAMVIIAAAVFGGFLFSGIWTYCTRRTTLDAAIELDRQFDFKERVSTLFSLEGNVSPAVAALQADVEKRANAIRVADRVPLRMPRHGWLPVLPLGLFLGIVFLVGPLDWLKQAEARQASPEERQRIVEQTKLLEKKLEEKQKIAAEQGFGEEIQDLAAKIEKATQDLATDKAVNSNEAVLKLSDLAKSIEERQKELSAVDNMKRNLSKLAETPEGPASEMANALKQGDLEKAAQEMKKLQEKLEGGNLSEKEQKQLAKQLSQMKDQLRKMANLSERAEQLKKSLPPELLQKELAKLAQDANQLQKLKEMAEKLGQCSECLSKEGLSHEAIDAMIAASKELQGMLKDERERQMLEDLLNDMAECRGGMCEGKDGNGGLNQRGTGQGKGIGRSGGPSERQDEDQADEERTRKLRAQGKPREGPVAVVGTADGGTFRGDSKLEILDAVRTASSSAEEAITRQRVPKDYQDHTRDYFERLHGQVKD